MTDEVTDAICFDMVVAQRDAARRRIKKLEAALDDVAGYLARADWYYLKPETRKALEGKNDLYKE